RKIHREHLNVIRGRLPYFGSLIGCLAGRLLRVPSVVSLGGDNRLPQEREGRYYFGNRWLSHGMERAVLRLATAIIVPNRFTLEYVVGVAGERVRAKVVIIPWVVELPAANGAAVDCAALGIPADRPIVLIVGHLNRYKYSAEMYEVSVRVLQRRPAAAHFVFCGDGPLRSEGEARLRERGAHFIGWQPHETVLELMRTAAVVLVPMSGFVLLEAAALAKPVVAGAVEWHGEVIVDGETGWLLNPDAADAWADRILWILDNRDRAAAVGRRLHDVFQREYSPDRALRCEADLYERLIEA
ncbi:MAG TPA: glycosyltransferase family 4 protein, partial [Vicinamibacterales bacterium]|nr:glycosyltransferase family 4 protein [Vicinamibacterales bacterium]